jgi:Tol biopolymer transport system component
MHRLLIGKPVGLLLLLTACGSGAPTVPAQSPTSEPSAVATPEASASASASGSEAPSVGADADAAGLAYVAEGQVFVVDADGSTRQVTDFDLEGTYGGATSAAWSPDGERLVASLGMPVGVSIAIVAAGGGEPLIVDGAAIPSWSPDGSQLAVGVPIDVVGPGGLNQLAVSVVDATSGEKEQVTTGWLPQWHPDGERLVVYRTVGESETSPGTPVLILVSLGDGAETELISGASDVRWAPDGSQAAYVFEPLDCLAPLCQEIRVTTPDGQLVPLVEGTSPSWSPDGSMLAFSFVARDGSQASRIGIVEVDTGRTADIAEGYGPVAWAPDGTRIAMTGIGRDGMGVVRVIGVDGGELLAQFPGQNPTWRPTQ